MPVRASEHTQGMARMRRQADRQRLHRRMRNRWSQNHRRGKRRRLAALVVAAEAAAADVAAAAEPAAGSAALT